MRIETARPDRLDRGFGYIVPGRGVDDDRTAYRVAAFHEKPAQRLAARIIRRGGLWNSFVMVGRVARFVELIRAIRPGGTAVIVGMAALNVRAPITPYTMALQEKVIKVTMYGSVRPNTDFPKLVNLYLDGRLKIDELISRTYKLEDINEGFTALRTGQVARGVVVFN